MKDKMINEYTRFYAAVRRLKFEVLKKFKIFWLIRKMGREIKQPWRRMYDRSTKIKTNNRSKRFYSLWDWSEFGIGFRIMKPHRCTVWKLCISIDFTFFSFLVYF